MTVQIELVVKAFQTADRFYPLHGEAAQQISFPVRSFEHQSESVESLQDIGYSVPNGAGHET